MPVTKWSISLMPDVAAHIDLRSIDRDNRSFVVNQQLKRYFDLLDQCRRDLRALLNDAECGLLLDVCNGVMFADPVSIRHLWGEVADAIKLDRVDQKWAVDGAALVEKLKGLSMGHLLAIVDSTELWWSRVSAGENPQPSELLGKNAYHDYSTIQTA